MDIKNATGKKGKNVKKLIVTVLAVVIFLGAIGTAGYFYNQNRKLSQNPDVVAQAQTAKLIETVGKLITLPTGETPSVATVADKSKLSEQPLFAKAENGDKVLIYINAKKIILYRPSTNKIMEVMSIPASTAPAPAEATPAAPVKK
jgi:hypothetical protein